MMEDACRFGVALVPFLPSKVDLSAPVGSKLTTQSFERLNDDRILIGDTDLSILIRSLLSLPSSSFSLRLLLAPFLTEIARTTLTLDIFSSSNLNDASDKQLAAHVTL